ncbi:TBC1 domain family member 2B-like [Watersipora subatra]|uniref:TBC1 domain family member 2B-like n=1 Tax=Watersipora subatra TaxID=2589382 RepID=UPI00355C074E
MTDALESAEEDVPSMRERQPKTKQPLCGYLTLHNKTGLLKSYNRKWFVYSDDGGRLLYYKSKGDTKPEGHILITHAIFTFDVKEKPGVFEIRTNDNVTVLEANDREEMFTWLQELQSRRKEITQRQSSKIKSYFTDKDGTIINDENAEVKPEVIAHPTIVLADSNRGERSGSNAAISKLSNNVSKAADSAKQKLTSMFNRKSVEMCSTCVALSTELEAAIETARMAKEELEANQQVLKMLHSQTDLLTEQIHILQNAKKIYSDPEMANQVDQETENLRLKHKVEELIKDSKRLTAENQRLELEVTNLKERACMCEETILAKDNVIISLSEQLERSSMPPGSPVAVDMFTESFHESVKDKLEAFELQNKFLNKEILELHTVRLDDKEKMDDLQRKNLEIEAKFYQLQSKYLLVLHETNKPHLVAEGDTAPPRDELMGQLLDEAMRGNQDKPSNPEKRDTLSSSFRAAKHYDSYGFEIEGWADDATIQAASLQSRSEQLVAIAHESPEAASLRVKWENFLAVMSTQEIHRSAEFKNLIRSGIPDNHRERVWNILIKLHLGKYQKAGYYEHMGKKHSKNKHNPVAKQIELDLNRTLPNNKYFSDESSDGVPKLRRVLLAYSYHNPHIGYCQGMNRVAAFALLFLKEEDAFWCLVAIIDFILPADYFSTSMVAAQADQRVLKEILSDKIPNVTKHLESLELDVSLFSFSWFLTLFIENIPTPTVLRIWDAFLFEGVKILFRYATAFFKHSEEDILRCTDYLSANQFLREMGTRMWDTQKITHIAFNNLNPFPIRMVHAKRALYLEQVKAELRELNALREEIKSQRAHLDYHSEDDEMKDDEEDETKEEDFADSVRVSPAAGDQAEPGSGPPLDTLIDI